MNWNENVIVARWLWKNTARTATEIAHDLNLKPALMPAILGYEEPIDPRVDTPVIYNNDTGKIHSVLKTPIAPSGELIGIYRYGTRGHYVGLVDSSQVVIKGEAA